MNLKVLSSKLNLKNKFDRSKMQIKNLSLYLFSTAISSIVSIILNPFLAVNLSPEDYAVIGYFTSFNTLFLPVLSFSLLSYYTRNFFRISDHERARVLDTLLTLQIILGLLSLLLLMVFFFIYMRVAHVGFGFSPYAYLCFIPVFFNCFYNFILVERRMKRQAGAFSRLTLLNTFISSALLIIFVVVLKLGAIGRFWAVFIAGMIFGCYSLLKLLGKPTLDREVIKDALKFGWPISLSAIFYYFLSGIDRALVEQIKDNQTFGNYNVAVQITTYLYMFYAVIFQTLEPDIYQSIAERRTGKLIKVSLAILVLNGVPNLIFILLANPIIDILTYGRYLDAVPFAKVMALKNITLSLCFLISDIIIGYGYPKVELVNRIIGAVLSFFLFKVLIGKFGFIGAAWGQSLAFLIMALISSVFIFYKFFNSKNKDNWSLFFK